MIKKLLNTLYVKTQGAMVKIDHDTLVVTSPDDEPFQVPLHHLGSLVFFGNVNATPQLIRRCADDGRQIVWMTKYGRFQARVTGPTTGNVLLRRAQHEALDDAGFAIDLACGFVEGKIGNQRHVLRRALRDGIPEPERVEDAADRLGELEEACPEAPSLEKLRGIEGTASTIYFEVFDHLLRSDEVTFEGRNRRPPRDPVNAVLSFAYTLLARECGAAVEGVGLDRQVGFLHTLRPGRASLGLDLMEEFRPVVADRAVLTLFNRGQLSLDDFEERPGGAVHLDDEGRETFLAHWQKRKQREVDHHLREEPVPIGLIPHLQARILARVLRGDIDRYRAYQPR